MPAKSTEEFVQEVSAASAERRAAEAAIIQSNLVIRSALKEWLNGRILRDTAQDLGISSAYLGDIRDGRRTISEDLVNRLAGARD